MTYARMVNTQGLFRTSGAANTLISFKALTDSKEGPTRAVPRPLGVLAWQVEKYRPCVRILEHDGHTLYQMSIDVGKGCSFTPFKFNGRGANQS